MAETESKQELSWENHLEAAIKGLRREWRTHLLPEEFWMHQRAARREMLLSWRSLLDARITRLEQAEKEKPKPTRIVVE